MKTLVGAAEPDEPARQPSVVVQITTAPGSVLIHGGLLATHWTSPATTTATQVGWVYDAVAGTTDATT